MRIGIDARNISHPQPGGLKLYTTALLQGLSQLGVADEFVGFLDRPMDTRHLRLAPNITLKPIRRYRRMWHEAWGLGQLMRAERVDVAHFTVNIAPLRAPHPMVMTIHDTFEVEPRRWRGLVLESAGRYRLPRQRMADWWWGWLCRVGARQADLVVCPSRASLEDLVRVLKVPRERIRIVPHGAADRFQPMPASEAEAVIGRLGLVRGYVLCFAAHDPRKNVERLVAAYAGMAGSLRAAHPLAVVVSSAAIRPAFERLGAGLGVPADMRIVVRPSDEEVVALYNAAALLGFPSLGEGFGAPVVEAMACGCPVLAANTTAIPEVAGDAALLVDPLSTQELQKGMETILTDSQYADRLRERGFDRARSFRWRRAAEGMMAVYREAVQS
jgi:glycosyltransferase involved in cell wall biosynthesis